MIKTELINEVAEASSFNIKQVKEIIESTLEVIKKHVKAGDEVVLRNFGTFKMVHRAEKKARNISKGTEILVPAKDIPVFKVSKQFLDD